MPTEHPSRPLFVAVTSIRSSSSSATEDSSAAKEDDPSARSSTKSRTQVVEPRRVACSTLSYPVASSNRSTSWA
jgi:hypothetical protein